MHGPGSKPPAVRVTSALVLLSCAAMLAGCGGAPASVSGTVTFESQPLPDGTIVFQAPELPMAVGQIVNGAYSIRTGNIDGLVPGEYRVTVSQWQPANADAGEAAAPVLLSPPRYNRVEQTPLSARIAPGSNRYDFELSR